MLFYLITLMETKDGEHIGRKKGTKNKIPAAVRSAIGKALDLYINTEDLKVSDEDEVAVSFLNDLVAMKPGERVAAITKLADFVAPKLQTTSLEMSQEARKTIEDRLEELSGE